MPRDNARNLIGIVRQRVAAPDHMQIRPDQKIVETVDVARRLAVKIEHRKRRPDRAERLPQTRRIATTRKLQQRKAALDAIVYRQLAGLEPDMRQAAPGQLVGTYSSIVGSGPPGSSTITGEPA